MVTGNLEENLAALHAASFAWAVACCRGNRQEAEEVLQTAYLKVLDGRARFAGRASFKTWLFAVIRRTADDRRRRQGVRRFLLARWGTDRPIGTPVAGPEERLDNTERRRRIRGALEVLSRRQRQVLELVFYHDLTVREAAEVMQVSIGAARVHYDRGKKALLRALSGESIL
jgi:RNA polymerase sigma-70 factor (ECF subfamily)